MVLLGFVNYQPPIVLGGLTALEFNLKTKYMEFTNVKPTDETAIVANNVLSVVFFAHFKSSNSESHKIERFFVEKTASDFFDWVCERQEELEKEHSKKYIVTICHIVR